MDKNKQGPEIIVLDIETMPDFKEIIKVWPGLSAYPGLTLKASITSIICFGYKYLGEKTTHCLNVWDTKGYKGDINNDKQLVKTIYEILKDADAVITQNGKRFDWKFIQTRLMKYGFPPLNKIPHIDTKQLAKQNLFLFNNRLSTIGKVLVDDDKMDNGGWDLWVKVYQGDKKAMEKMSRYCKQDVRLTEKVFNKLKPFATNIPNHNLWSEGKKVCPSCGSKRLKSNGWKRTKTKEYRQMRCLDCLSFCRTDTRDKNPRSVA